MESNTITAEFAKFSAYGSKAWSGNEPQVTVVLRDGYSDGTGVTFTEEEAVKMIDILEKALAEARNAADHDPTLWDDTPF